MMGSEHNPGVIPLAMADVFHTIKNVRFLSRSTRLILHNITDLSLFSGVDLNPHHVMLSIFPVSK